MIGKFVVYILVGLLTNAVLTAWLFIIMYRKCRNDSDGSIFNDLYNKYLELTVERGQQMFFIKKKSKSESGESSVDIQEEARWYNERIHELNATDWIMILITFVVLWPYEVIYNKGYTIPRFIAYAKKYDKT